MSERPDRCENCRFWDKRPHDKEADCRRRSPVITGTTLPSNSYDSMRPHWPKTWHYHWCGDFEATLEPR